ncbi:hypothetical protein HYALB_00009351 [Hymenoscyphus albidus]|uniref:Uncharacterized protein n=1 Tax=Hymenoscyphus albidus TaxID=595503 RepID=A0A9N9LL98_9HELO|nr:hypothetical protein HYALB_00009351 [Hymenoscyphus albidus]
MQIRNIVSVIALATAVSAQAPIYYKYAWCISATGTMFDTATINACNAFKATCADCELILPELTTSGEKTGPYCQSPTSKIDSAKFLEACKAQNAPNSSGGANKPKGA